MKTKFIFIFTFLILPASFATDGTTPGGEEAIAQLANQQLARKKVIADRLIADYYNAILGYMQNPGNFDDRLKTERFQGPLLVETMPDTPDSENLDEKRKFFYYNSGIENQINGRQQLFIPSKLGYSMRVEAMESIDPRPSKGNIDQVDPPSVYNIVLKALIYRLLLEDEKKLTHTKYFDIKGIMDISLFNTCQLPIQTSRQLRRIPDESNDDAVNRLSQVDNGYRDYVTYGSTAYQKYFDWLKAEGSPIIDVENNQIKTLDFASYYTQFKRSPAEIKEKFFADVSEEEFEDGGDITFGIRYERYRATQPRSELFRPVQIFDHINLLGENFGDGQYTIDENLIAKSVREFINSEVWFNPNPPSLPSGNNEPAKKFYVHPERPAGSIDTQDYSILGYTKVPLTSIKPRVLGFYCMGGASNIPNTQAAAARYKTEAASINSKIDALIRQFPSQEAGFSAAKVAQSTIDRCQDNGDDCNALLAEIRKSACFEASYKGLKVFFESLQEETNELAQDLGKYFEMGDSNEKIQVVASSFPAHAAVQAIAADQTPQPIKFYIGTARTTGFVNYIYCNETSGVYSAGNPIAGFSRRRDCAGDKENIEDYLDPSRDVPENVRTSLQKALAKVQDGGKRPERDDMEVVKNHFYRPDQYLKLGIIFSFEGNPGDTQPIQTSCADGIGIRFYGQEKDGEGTSTEHIDPNPFKNVQRLDKMPLGAEVDQPIPLCRELANEEGKSRNIAKSEVRHCYRLKRNLGILTNADSQD